jgi:MFS family permease
MSLQTPDSKEDSCDHHSIISSSGDSTLTELVNLTVTVYMIFQGPSPSFWGSQANIRGRRSVYLATLIVYMGSCIGLALAPIYWLC